MIIGFEIARFNVVKFVQNSTFEANSIQMPFSILTGLLFI